MPSEFRPLLRYHQNFNLVPSMSYCDGAVRKTVKWKLHAPIRYEMKYLKCYPFYAELQIYSYVYTPNDNTPFLPGFRFHDAWWA